MKNMVSKRILSMLLALVMLVGLLPAFALPANAETAANNLEGKTAITKVDLLIEFPTYHDQMRGYDACDETNVVNLYYRPFSVDDDRKEVYQNGKLLTYDKLEAGVPAQMYIRLEARDWDTAYAFDYENKDNVEIWVNGVKMEDAYLYMLSSDTWRYAEVVIPFTVEEYTGQTVNVNFDTDGLAEVPTQKVMKGGYVEKPQDPVCDGKIFEGWYTDAERTTPFDFYNTSIDSAITLYAKWEQNVTKIDLLLTDNKDNPREDFLTDAMTGREARKALKLSYVRGQGYYVSDSYDLYQINLEVDQSDDLLEAGRSYHLKIQIYSEANKNIFFDLEKLNDIEFWINGQRRTDVVIEETFDNSHIEIHVPVNVVTNIPTYYEVINNDGYTRYVSDWKELRDVFTNLNQEAVERFGKLRVKLTKDLYTEEVYIVEDYFAKMKIPAGLDVVFDFGTHTIGGNIDIQRGDFPRHYYYPNDFLLFYLGKDSTLTFEAEESGGIRLNALQGGDDTFAAVRVMSDYPRAGRGASYPATFIVNGGSYILTCNADSCVDSGTLGHSKRYRETLYRGTVIADHVNVEINDGVFEVRTENKGNFGRELTAFGTVISKESLHLDKAPEGEYYPYVETGRTVINDGTFRAVGGGYAIHHFSFADIVINSKLDVPIEELSIEERQLLFAQENDYYHINYPTICGGAFVGGLGFTGFTYTYSNGNGMLNAHPASDILGGDCVGIYRSGDIERRDILDLTWKDLHDNEQLIVYSKTMITDMTITPNGGWDDTKDKATKPYEVQEGDEITFKVDCSFISRGEYTGTVTWTVAPTDPGYEAYSISGDSITISFAERQHLMGITLKATILVNTAYGQVKKTVELPVNVQRKIDILTYTPGLTYEGPEYVMDGESFYFYIRGKDFYEYDASTLVVEVDGQEVKPVGDGRYIVSNVQWKANTNIQINATADTRGYSKFTFIVPVAGVTNKTRTVYKGELLTLPTLGEVGFKLPTGVTFAGWRIPGYGIYQPGETVKVTTTKAITVTGTFEGVYHVIMEDGAKAYSDEAHTTSISAAKENDYIYITAPEVEGMQFYYWNYELLADSYQSPYFGDAGSPETWVLMPPAGIVLTPTYVTPVQQVTISGVTKPVAGEEFSYNYEDGVAETDRIYIGSSRWYHVVDGTETEITYKDGVIFRAGETYRYTTVLGIPSAAEGVYGLPENLYDLNVTLEGISPRDYELTLAYTDKYQDRIRVTVEFTLSEDAGVTLSGTITSFGDDTDDVLIELIPQGLPKTAYYTIVTGNTAKFNIVNVAPDTYIMKVSKENHVTGEYTVVVGSSALTQDATIYLIGDEDCDGKVDVVVPTLTLNHPSLSFEDEILYNVYYGIDNTTSVVEMGLITFESKLADGTIADAVDVIPGYVSSGTTYMVQSRGIPAKKLGDALYFKVYAKLSDGTYAYSDVAGYNAVLYAKTVLGNASTTTAAKALMVAMLNYGTAAQEYFGYKTDAPMNSFLSAAGKALVAEYDPSMVADVVKPDASKSGSFVMNGGYSNMYPTVSFEGAFAINFYFTPSKSVDDGLTFYYWDAKTYNAVDVLTAENATGVICAVNDGKGNWGAAVEGIAAKALDETVYVAGVYTSGGVQYPTKIVAYSLGDYCKTIAAKGEAFGAATAVYGYYAKAYFAK